MTKNELVEQIMRRFGYDRLSATQQDATRRVYGRMTKRNLERLVASPRSS
jgi:hypothetical protein